MNKFEPSPSTIVIIHIVEYEQMLQYIVTI